MQYAGSALKFGVAGAGLGAALGLYSAYVDGKRRTTRHLGLESLVYLDQHDELVYALSCLRDRSNVNVEELAKALNNVAELAARVDSEQYVGSLQIYAFRESGRIYGMLNEISAAHEPSPDPDFREHLQTIEGFCDDTRHNQALHTSSAE